MGDYRSAIDNARKAGQLFPNAPPGLRRILARNQAWAHYLLGEHAEVERPAGSLLRDDTSREEGRILLIASYVGANKLDEARTQVRKLVDERPDFTLSTWKSPVVEQLEDKTVMPALVTALGKAGLPVTSP